MVLRRPGLKRGGRVEPLGKLYRTSLLNCENTGRAKKRRERTRHRCVHHIKNCTRSILGQAPYCAWQESVLYTARIDLVHGHDPSGAWPRCAGQDPSGVQPGSIWCLARVNWRLAGIHLAPGWDPPGAWLGSIWCLARVHLVPGPGTRLEFCLGVFGAQHGSLSNEKRKKIQD